MFNVKIVTRDKVRDLVCVPLTVAMAEIAHASIQDGFVQAEIIGLSVPKASHFHLTMSEVSR